MYKVRFPLKNTLNYTIFVPKILAVLLDYSLRFGQVGVDDVLDCVRLISVHRCGVIQNLRNNFLSTGLTVMTILLYCC